MTQNTVYMNIPEVQNISKTFATLNQVLNGVSQALGVLIDTLKATAFIGMVGGLAEAHFLEIMKKQLDQMAAKFDELSKDVKAAVDAYERGDEQGATKFH
ncbi:MAG TPA: type VII secretion target [Chloroflexota bacterium]|nr:type VII secretion target [Chloroflexota bacterium]